MPAGIKIEGLKNLQKRIEEMPLQIQKTVNSELNDGANRIARLAKQLAPTDEGRLKQSISADTNTFLHKEVAANVFYAPYIEFGTGKKVKIPPGLESVAAEFRNQPKRGNFDDMVDSLQEWIRRKGLAGTYSTRTQRRTGNPLARAIQDRQLARHLAILILKNGIKPQPFFFRAYDATKKDIETKITSAIG